MGQHEQNMVLPGYPARALAKLLRSTGLDGWARSVMPLRLNGQSIRVPNVKGIFIDRITEPWMTEIIQRLYASRTGAFVDIGVNLGQTLVKVKTVDPEIPYFGFEPNPTCIYYVNRLIEENRFTACTLVPVGISDVTGLVELEFFSENNVDQAASIVRNYRPASHVFHKEFVPVFRFDEVSERLEIPDMGVVKIDVEGAELEVLTSMRSAIKRQRPAVILEILPSYSTGSQMRIQRQEAIEALFAVSHYKMWRITKTGSDTFQAFQAIDQVGIHGDLRQCDYLALPCEQALPV